MGDRMTQGDVTSGNAAMNSGGADAYRFLQKLTIADVVAHAEQLVADTPTSSAALYKNWIACNSNDQWLHVAYFNYSVALAKSGDRLGAINATRECIRLKPEFQPSYINLGRLLEDAGQVGEAITQWKALTDQLKGINGDAVKNKLMALEQLGRVLEGNNLDSAAEDVLKQSIEIVVAQPHVIQHWIAMRQRQCKWPVVVGWDHVRTEALMAGISPLSLANLADDPLFQLSRACAYNRELVGPLNHSGAGSISASAPRQKSGKLRIGYVSSDLREHAVGFAMTDVLEQHDKSAFEIRAYYCGIERVDPTRNRIRESVDFWFDINGLTDEQAAARIREDEIDILVDLNGYTKDARARVFAHRPAPIAVNWFGFPGTMGSPHHHYIIADEHVIPPGSECYYSEKVLRLPCYQANDRKRQVSLVSPTRSDEGLPEDAIVYCCLNGMQKLTSLVFTSWMSILKQHPKGVLWLLGGTEDTNARLRTIAGQRGISPERLIFAARKPNPEHLARYALADLFLDTIPYGAHTTAADAMWMGVPVLTVPGKSFASRVCASVVTAAGIGEMVCEDIDHYVSRAVELGRRPDLLSAIKQKLVSGRQTCLLFDTPRLVNGLEDLYRLMWEDFQAGRRHVPDLSNLDFYNELGVELNVSNIQFASEKEYRAFYEEKMAARNAISPIGADSRVWKGAGRQFEPSGAFSRNGGPSRLQPAVSALHRAT
jgi:predicted O-linked N-acetylglucosamine transferase (SPINDLY family)